jgi:hypothetical protein
LPNLRAASRPNSWATRNQAIRVSRADARRPFSNPGFRDQTLGAIYFGDPTSATPSSPDDTVGLSGFVHVSAETTLKRSNSPVSIAILIAAGPKRTVH